MPGKVDKVLSHAYETQRIASLLSYGYRKKVIEAELKVTTSRVSRVFSELKALNISSLTSGQCSLPTARHILQKKKALDATCFIKCLMARTKHIGDVRGMRFELETIRSAHIDYIKFMYSDTGVEGDESQPMIKINEAYVLARDLSDDLIRIYRCKKCDNDRVVHEEQKTSSNCQFCKSH